MRYRFLRFPGGLEKAVTFSYDDGCEEDIRLVEAFDKYKVKATFNLVSEERRRVITKEQIQEYFLNRGHEIAVHGAHHMAEGVVRPIDGIRDVLNCRIELEERYGRIIRGMAYPESGIRKFANETSYEKVKNYLKELDIVYARALGGDNNSFELPNDWHAWMPTAHHNNPEILNWIDEFVNINLSSYPPTARLTPKLFYIWGHSYEFERQNNWEHLDAILSKLAGKEDTWYATNIEIYEYVNAFYSLVVSARGDMVYNPTVFDIWFNVDGIDYKVDSGKTIVIN